MNIEGLFLMWLIIAVTILAIVVVVILAFLLYNTRDTVDMLKKDFDLLETQNMHIKDRVLELECKFECSKCKKHKERDNG